MIGVALAFFIGEWPYLGIEDVVMSNLPHAETEAIARKKKRPARCKMCRITLIFGGKIRKS